MSEQSNKWKSGQQGTWKDCPRYKIRVTGCSNFDCNNCGNELEIDTEVCEVVEPTIKIVRIKKQHYPFLNMWNKIIGLPSVETMQKRWKEEQLETTTNKTYNQSYGEKGISISSQYNNALNQKFEKTNNLKDVTPIITKYKRVTPKLKKGYRVSLKKGICKSCEENRIVTKHHIIPRSIGGKNTNNIINLCKECHDRIELYTHDLISQNKFENTEANKEHIRKLILSGVI